MTLTRLLQRLSWIIDKDLNQILTENSNEIGHMGESLGKRTERRGSDFYSRTAQTLSIDHKFQEKGLEKEVSDELACGEEAN
jgi:hypothetical protein